MQMSRTPLVLTRNMPKTKATAGNQIIEMNKELASLSRRKENLMSQITNSQAKLKRLEEALTGYQNQLQKVVDSAGDMEATRQLILKKFQLTEAEILETKSQILREQLESIQAQSGEPGGPLLNRSNRFIDQTE